MTSNSGAALVKKGHPIRGILWGIMFGLGLAVVLVLTKVIALDLTQMLIVLLVGIAVGVLWSLFGPAKAPKGSPPTAAVDRAEAPLESVVDDEVNAEMADGANDSTGERDDLDSDALEDLGEATDKDVDGGWRSND